MVHDERQRLRQLIDGRRSLQEVGSRVQLTLLLNLLLQEGSCPRQGLCPHWRALPVYICNIHLQDDRALL